MGRAHLRDFEAACDDVMKVYCDGNLAKLATLQ
jgi:hypothetical protein